MVDVVYINRCLRHSVKSTSDHIQSVRDGRSGWWLEVSEAKRLKGLASENAKLKKLLADTRGTNAYGADPLTVRPKRA